ncbi:cytochrome c biogenesis protein CcsA [Chungangia koreensis]|uniref:Cytochrome c biogenesis protein CcsA n=1 Tax=Chungangia koreensis TaxID=752657 RepID=A0ABV8X4J9_9LACT
MADALARLHEVMIVLYAVSLIFYFIDYLNKDKTARRVAFWIISAIWIIQTGVLLLTIIQTGKFPVLSLTQGIYFYVWLLILLSIIMHCIARVDLPVFFLNIIGFIFLTIHTFAPIKIEQSSIGESLVSELLFFHITFAIMSYAAFSLSFVFSVLYQILYYFLKKKKWTKQWGRLPSLTQTEKGMSASMLVGIPMLGISLILGLQWAYITLDEYTVLDAKIVGSVMMLVIYCLLLYLNRRGKIVGVNYAWGHIYTFLLLMANFFLGSRLSDFHFWY